MKDIISFVCEKFANLQRGDEFYTRYKDENILIDRLNKEREEKANPLFFLLFWPEYRQQCSRKVYRE